MKELIKNQPISTYELQKIIGVGHYTLYRYINGERDIEKMPVKMILDISKAFNITPNELYKRMKENR